LAGVFNVLPLSSFLIVLIGLVSSLFNIGYFGGGDKLGFNARFMATGRLGTQALSCDAGWILQLFQAALVIFIVVSCASLLSTITSRFGRPIIAGLLFGVVSLRDGLLLLKSVDIEVDEIVFLPLLYSVNIFFSMLNLEFVIIGKLVKSMDTKVEGS